MKKHLLMTLLVGISLHAEENPFDLKKNLEKIDQDQEVLLAALKEMRAKKKVHKEADVKKGTSNKSVNIKRIHREKKNATAFVKIEQDLKAQRLALEKKTAKIKKEAALALKEKEAKKREEERLEVVAYEKEKRIRQKAKEASQNKSVVSMKIEQKKMIKKKDLDNAFTKAIAEVDVEN